MIELVSKLSDRARCSPAEAIDRISSLILPETDADRDRAMLAILVARIKRLRLRRNELFGAALFRDPAWDMLLELYVAHEHNETLTASSLCYAVDVPVSTGTRMIQRLEDHGLVTREGDQEDCRRLIVKPTAKAVTSVRKMATVLLGEIEALSETGDGEPACKTPRVA